MAGDERWRNLEQRVWSSASGFRPLFLFLSPPSAKFCEVLPVCDWRTYDGVVGEWKWAQVWKFGLRIPVAEPVNVKTPCLPDSTQSLLSRLTLQHPIPSSFLQSSLELLPRSYLCRFHVVCFHREETLAGVTEKGPLRLCCRREWDQPSSGKRIRGSSGHISHSSPQAQDDGRKRKFRVPRFVTGNPAVFPA